MGQIIYPGPHASVDVYLSTGMVTLQRNVQYVVPDVDEVKLLGQGWLPGADGVPAIMPPVPTTPVWRQAAVNVRSAGNGARVVVDGASESGFSLESGKRLRLTVYGHSFAEGAGASRNNLACWSLGFGDVLGRLLGASVDNKAISGSGISGASLPSFGPMILSARAAGLSLSATTPTGPPVQAAALLSAINDMTDAQIMAEPSILADYVHACILRLRSPMGGRTTDSGWTFSQSSGATDWTATGSGFSMGTVKGATANGNQWQLALPSAFPGGDVYVMGIRISGSGSTHAVTVDGAAHGTWDTRGATQAKYRPMYYKITGLSAGAHTIAGVVSNYVGTDFIQGWLCDQPSVAPPIAYGGAARAPVYPGGGAHTIVDADVAPVNAALAVVANRFADCRVKWIDIDAILGKNTALFDMVGYNGTVGVHPNTQGHALLAQAFADALKTIQPADSAVSNAYTWPETVLSWPRLQSSGEPYEKPRIGIATLDAAGTVTVSSRAIMPETVVMLTPKTATGTPRVSAQASSSGTTAGSFTITSSAGASDSGKTVNWMLVDYVL